MSEIGNLLNIDRPSLSRVVDRLYKRGLVERQQDPSNRRVIRLHLTDVSRALLLDMAEQRESRVREVFDSFDEQSAQRIADSLIDLADATETMARVKQFYPIPTGADPIVQLLTNFPRSRRTPPRD